MTANKFETLIHQGFRSVIVNRPDQEQGNLVSVNQLPINCVILPNKIILVLFINQLPVLKFLKQT